MLNKVILIGNLGDDPKITTLNDGSKIANLPLATTESYKNKQGEKVNNTEWHKLVCYGKGAEILEKYTSKGSKLYVEGSIHTRSWEDKDGNKRYSTEIKVREFKFLGGNNDSQQSSSASAPSPSDFEEDDDDLPF